MLIVGDVHGKINEFYKILQKYPNEDIFQLGDFGFKKQHLWAKNNLKENQKIIFGNHDYYPMLNESYSVGNFKYFPTLNTFTIRGAQSIDKYIRTEGIDWFNNEELTYSEINELFDSILEIKPKIILSHTCPEIVQETLFGYNSNNIKNKSRTTQMLQSLFELYQPEYWIFGHHHKSVNIQMNETKFICLTELETLNL